MHRTTLATMRNSMLAGILAFSLIACPALAKNDDNTSQIPSANAAPTSYTPNGGEGDSVMGGSGTGANKAGASAATSPTTDLSPEAAPPAPVADMAPAPKDNMQTAEQGQPMNLLTPPAQAQMRGGDNAMQGMSDMPMAMPMPAYAMTAGDGTDPLANFGPSSGTVVGNRALQLRDEVLRLRASVNLNSNEFAIQRSSGTAGAVQYHSTVAAITARLQNGTTHGNPILLRQWDEANQALNEVSSSMGRLNSLQTSVDADASLASYLLGSIQAGFDLSGAIDEDQDQLKLLRDEVSRLVVQLDYLRNQITNDIERQTAYLTSERSNLQTLAFSISRGELIGNNLASRPVIVNPMPVWSMPQVTSIPPMPQMAASPVAPVSASGMHPGMAGPAPMSPATYMQESGQSPMPVSPATGVATSSPDVGLAPTIGHLLVLIRYNQPVVNYEAQLSKAVGDALERRPNAQFAVVAVTPSSGDPADLAKQKETAQRDADGVKRSLVQLGLSPSRISMANTATQNASTPEVHVYIR